MSRISNGYKLSFQADVNLYALLPEYFQEILDFKELMKAEQIEFERFVAYMYRVYDNLFIQTCDEETLRYWEALLGIIIEDDDTLEIRRIRILNRYRRLPPFTLPRLYETLNELFGNSEAYRVEIDYIALTLDIYIYSGEYGIIAEVENTLLSMVPAHIALSSIQELNTEADQTVYYASGMTYATFYDI